MKHALRLAATSLGCLMLGGCGLFGWIGGEEDEPDLPGNRISVLQLEQLLEPDPLLTGRPVDVPPPIVNTEWAQPGAVRTNAPGHLALPMDLREAWRVKVEGSSRVARLLTTPIVVNGRVFVMDTEFDLHAFDEATGAEIWTRNMKREGQEGEAIGGGASFADGRLYVTTGYGEAIALNPETGEEFWRQRIAAPIRAAPTVSDGRVFVVTIDNQIIVLAAENRVLQWTHAGIEEEAALLGGASAAVDGGIVLVPYSSGELFALRIENGRPAWQDSLATVRRGQNVAALADIRGFPVVDRGQVVVISHSGRMAAIDERTGQRIWEQDIGGINTPWVAGDWVFVLSNENQVVALSRDEGRVRWIHQLKQFRDPDDRDGPIRFTGPVLAGGRLLLASSEEELVELSIADGSEIGRWDLPGEVIVPLVVANNTLFVLTEDGDLVAYR